MRTAKLRCLVLPEIGGERGQLFLQVKCGKAGALRVILMSDRRSEERHDPVPRVLVDGPFEPMHSGGQGLEETIEHLVPGLGADALRERLRPFHIGEEHRHLLAFSLERGAGGEDLLREVG